MARLVAESGPVPTGKEWKIDPGLTLGRENHNTIGMPENKKSSRDHAKVWREGPGKYAIADLGSTNGTLVNDEKVTRHSLVDGDEVRVGEATFRFVLDDDEKPKKREGGARVAELLAGRAPSETSGPAPLGTSGKPPAGPTLEVKSRILQYQKKSAKGGMAGWDLSQASEGVRWLVYLVVLGVAAGLFFLIKQLISG